MKWKILLVICFISKFAFAQLSVSGNNYIYATTSVAANDVYIFVEDDVNLEDTNSYLYLRNDAQLLQGTGTTGNSGVGQLSAYQNGTTHNYAYNYWCSPVGNTDTDDNANRAFRLNNNIYDVTTAPITSSLATYTTAYDGTSSPLVISNRWLYTYSPGTTNSEWNYIGDTGNVTTGYGFTMKGTSGSGNNQLYDFRGKPNNGTISTNVLNGEWSLIGNPYPSALDALDFIYDTQNQTSINGSLYYWEQDLSVNSHNVADYAGGYASYTITSDGVTETYIDATFDTYNRDGTINTTGGARTSPKTARRYIAIGQGFMVIGTANSTARTQNSHRQYYKQSDTDSEFFRIANSDKKKKLVTNAIIYDNSGLQILPSEYKRFRLNIDFNDVYTRQILQNFHHTATNGFDYGLEIESPEGVSSDAHWVLNDKPYIAQAFNFDEDLKIPLVVNVNNENQLIRFRIHDVQNFNTGQTIFLHDIETDTYVDLTKQNYELNLEVGNYANRFEITFTNNFLENTESELDQFVIFQNNTESLLTISNPNSLSINDLALYDVSGKQIFRHENLSPNTKHEFSTENLSNGVYVVSVKIKNYTINKKVIISNK
ncbi:T9SS type A sorting domain-containing protein [Pontimicrobium sp. SW4]|uniref:T9SS type A sorting domain-containing protein n=1 Tax=Pontimicrobium sp. SW4 TaxID=3153519 RepID=A0AAU7BNB3_9FLAO